MYSTVNAARSTLAQWQVIHVAQVTHVAHVTHVLQVTQQCCVPMQLEGVWSIPMRGFLSQVFGEVDDGDGLEGTLLQKKMPARTNAHRYRMVYTHVHLYIHSGSGVQLFGPMRDDATNSRSSLRNNLTN